MSEFEVHQVVYIISERDNWYLLEALDNDLEIIRGEITQKTVGTMPGADAELYYRYEIREDWNTSYVYRRSPNRIFHTETEAKLALEKERQDRIQTKKRAYEVLKKQLQELGEQR